MGDSHAKDGDLCVQPIYWHLKTLEPVGKDKHGQSVYKATPPEPEDGQYTGYYIELIFPMGEKIGPFDLISNEFSVSTSGYYWPTSQPYEQCNWDD